MLEARAVVGKATINRPKQVNGKDVVLSRPWFAMKNRETVKADIHVLLNANRENVALA